MAENAITKPFREISSTLLSRFFKNFQEEDKDDWTKNAYMIMDMLGPNPETGDTGVIDIPDDYVKTKNYV